jgi:hypothetical protein
MTASASTQRIQPFDRPLAFLCAALAQILLQLVTLSALAQTGLSLLMAASILHSPWCMQLLTRTQPHINSTHTAL